MNAQVNSAGARSLGLGMAWCCAGVLGLALAACGGDDAAPPLSTVQDAGTDDAGGDEQPVVDAAWPIVPDAGQSTPGDPPPELEGSACAVDTNKLYDVVTLDRPPAPVQLAVDNVQSRFGAAFIGDSEACIDALYLANLQGASGVGEPEVTLVSDACTTVTHTAIAHTGDRWLMAVVDARMDFYDLWLQAYDGRTEFAPQRLSENLGQESDVALSLVGYAPMDTLAAMAAWVERNADTGESSLHVRPLTLEGEPAGDTVELEPPGTWSFASVSLDQLGTDHAALAYRRTGSDGVSEIVLDVLSAVTGEREREPWVLARDVGSYATVELGTDAEGGGIIYSVGELSSQHLWFQALDAGGHAAPVQVGNDIGGPSAPRRVVGAPHHATDASLAKLPVGYAVAYRALPGGTVDSPRIRVQFLDRLGTPRALSDVALASEFGGRAAIESGSDGRIVIGWTDAAEDGTSTLTIVKLPCVGG